MLRVLSVLAGSLALAACGQTSIQSMSNVFTPGLARPEAIVVSGFDFSSDVVLLDRGFAAQLQRKLGKTPPEKVREQLAARVSQEIGNAMVTTLREAGLPARSGGEGGVTGDQPALLVTGKIRAIDQGNRTQRNVIGFGAGKSEVTADVSVAHLSSSGKKEVLTFAAEAESGMKPGAVVTAPIGAAQSAATRVASAGAGAVSEKLSVDVEAHARRLGQAAARRIIVYAMEQGWAKPGTESPDISAQ